MPRIRQFKLKNEVAKVIRFAYYRNLAAAESQLDTVTKKPLLRYKEYGQGVYLGLKGLLEALRGKEDVAFVSRLLKTEGAVPPLKFGEQDLGEVLDDFDAGYMDVWKLISYLIGDLKAHAPPPAEEE